MNQQKCKATGKDEPYPERAKPVNILDHAMPERLAALPSGTTPALLHRGPHQRVTCFVNQHDLKGDVYTASSDFTLKTYADLIEDYDRHPERKFTGTNGRPCQSETKGCCRTHRLS